MSSISQKTLRKIVFDWKSVYIWIFICSIVNKEQNCSNRRMKNPINYTNYSLKLLFLRQRRSFLSTERSILRQIHTIKYQLVDQIYRSVLNLHIFNTFKAVLDILKTYWEMKSTNYMYKLDLFHNTFKAAYKYQIFLLPSKNNFDSKAAFVALNIKWYLQDHKGTFMINKNISNGLSSLLCHIKMKNGVKNSYFGTKT